MFKLTKEDHFSWPVKFSVPQSNGQEKDYSMLAEFKFVNNDRLKEIMTEEEDSEDFLDDVLVGWSKFKDIDGNDVPYNDETRSYALTQTPIISAMVRAFFAAMGGKKARRKNS